MTIERMQEIMAQLGFGFRDYKNFFEFDVKDVHVVINKALTRGNVEASLISIPYWYELACQSLSEEKIGGGLMTIERMQEIMAQLGFGFRDYKNFFEFDVKDVRVVINKALTRGNVEASLISIPYWYELACQSLSEEKKGGRQC